MKYTLQLISYSAPTDEVFLEKLKVTFRVNLIESYIASVDIYVQ